MGRARKTVAARRDFFEIWKWVARDSIDAADRLLLRLDEAISLLAQYPGIGTARDEVAPALRSYPVGNYLILYRRVRGGIQVARVVHGARDLRRIFRRGRRR